MFRVSILLPFLLFFFSFIVFSQQQSCSPSALPNAVVPPGFCAKIWANGFAYPRGIAVASNNDVLVVEVVPQRITVLWNDGTQRATLARASGLNHGIVISDDGFLYASSSRQVYRWSYTPGDRSDLGTPEIVVQNIPCCHHSSRTLLLNDGFLYVQSGSGSNVDPDSSHAQIRRFPLTWFADLSETVIDWSQGELFADGLRNEVGVRTDPQGNIWGVENGCDDLNRNDLGGDIHEDNPSEEVNLFAQPGRFYGYPYCWSEFNLSRSVGGGNPGNQWVHENFQNRPPYSDAWCRDVRNVVRPVFNMQAHMAPLDILFWNVSGFPDQYYGNAFVAFHGSWNRPVPVGYRVDVLLVTGTTVTGSKTFLRYAGPGDTGEDWIRPVSLGIIRCATGYCLLISSDATGELISVSYG